jgi:hypothetical protein
MIGGGDEHMDVCKLKKRVLYRPPISEAVPTPGSSGFTFNSHRMYTESSNTTPALSIGLGAYSPKKTCENLPGDNLETLWLLNNLRTSGVVHEKADFTFPHPFDAYDGIPLMAAICGAYVVAGKINLLYTNYAARTIGI